MLTISIPSFLYYFFFFFQAEDGIRDKLVTGVQTCALPISFLARAPSHSTGYCSGSESFIPSRGASFMTTLSINGRDVTVRSEERRVGKECRSRWSPYH